MNGLAVQFLGEGEQHLSHVAARLQPVRARAVIPLLETLQFELQPQHLDAEFLGSPLLFFRVLLLSFTRAAVLPRVALPSRSERANAPSPSALRCPRVS